MKKKLNIKEIPLQAFSNSFYFLVPKQYIKDGQLIKGKKYDLKITEAEITIEEHGDLNTNAE